MSSAGQLEGRTALITGASQGMGKVIAKRFAGEGAKVVLVARSRERLAETAQEIEAAGGRALVAPTDVGDAAEVDALAQRVEAEVGPLDAVVSNSGITGPTAELWKVAPEDWEETIRVNLTGTFLLCRALLPAMVARGSGSVVVIGSASGKRPLYGRTPYAASKLGARRLGPDARARARASRRARQPDFTRRDRRAANRIRDPRASARSRDLLRGDLRGSDERDAASAPHPARGRCRRRRFSRLGRLSLDHRRGHERLRRTGDVLTPRGRLK